MENKQEKKEYVAPAMEIIEYKHESCLLVDSDPENIDGGVVDFD